MNPTRERLASRVKDIVSNKGILKISKDIVYEALTSPHSKFSFKEKVELAKAFCIKEMPQKLEGDVLNQVIQFILPLPEGMKTPNRLDNAVEIES